MPEPTQIPTSYNMPIHVGTHINDRRMGENNLYLELPANAPRRMVLTRAESLRLASVLINTVDVLLPDD